MRQSAGRYKKIVVKIGSSLFCSHGRELDCSLLADLTSQVAHLLQDGVEVVLVSSGAIAMGMEALKLKERPKELSYLQAAAATGQHELMDAYRRFFKAKGLNCAQLLLTWDDFGGRERYLNAKNTLETLLKLKSVPVVNENDTVSTEEIKFGDNDRLSALVACLVGADLLLILSDVDGLLDKDRKTVRLVEKITPQVKALVCPAKKKTCVGGMLSKIEAARIAIDSGIACVIADGRQKNIIIESVQAPGSSGTLFLPRKDSLAAKKRWLAFSAKAKGKIIVDEGAKEALINKKSLLAVGIVACEGDFDAGDVVSLRDKGNCEFGRGKARLSKRELEGVKGKRFDKEIVHRDDIVIV